jgi:hypothetical protein
LGFTVLGSHPTLASLMRQGKFPEWLHLYDESFSGGVCIK